MDIDEDYRMREHEQEKYKQRILKSCAPQEIPCYKTVLH